MALPSPRTSRRRRRRRITPAGPRRTVAARPARLERLRARFASLEVEAYFGTRPRAQPLPDRASSSPTARRRSRATRASSSSGATRSSCWPTRGTRSRPAERRRTRGSSTPATTCRAPGPSSSRRSVRSGSRSRPGSCRTRCGGGSRPPRRTSSSSRSRAGSRPIGRRRSRAELERVAAACAVADRALATLLPRIGPGVTEQELALELEWLLRTGGAEAIAFDPTCLVGPDGGAARTARRLTRSSRPVASSCSTSAPRSTAIAAT